MYSALKLKKEIKIIFEGKKFKNDILMRSFHNIFGIVNKHYKVCFFQRKGRCITAIFGIKIFEHGHAVVVFTRHQKNEISVYFLDSSIVKGWGTMRLKVSMVQRVSRLKAATF